MPLQGWLVRALRLLAVALAVVFACVSTFAAVVMPYRLWDSLAFGSWSRSIAEGQGLWANAPALFLQRPLFYVEQGLAWTAFGDDEWIGRLVSLSFAAILWTSVWILAARLTADREGRAVLPPLATSLVLASSVLAIYVAAGMSDVPVAAMAAATGAALWARRAGYANAALVAALAAATVLAKPTGLLALAGLAAAAFCVQGRRATRSVIALAIGVVLAVVYNAWQANRLHMSVVDFLTAGNDAFWRERGAAARWDALIRAEWFGAGLRLVVLYGLAHAALRLAGARPRIALAVAGVAAISWSVVGPVVADGALAYPFDGSVLALVAWLGLAAMMVVAPFFAIDRDPVGRRTHAALLVWLAPTSLAWAWQRADEVRHLAPAWAPIALVTAAALASLTLSLARFKPVAALAPAAAVALLVLANLPSIDGLGRDGWRGLIELGRSGWSSRAEMENYAYGPLSYELDAARANVSGGERIVSSNGRLAYFFPGRVDFGYPSTCAELDGTRFFSFLRSGESLEFASQEGQPVEPLAWLQCRSPHLELVSERAGIYAAFVVGEPPLRTPAPGDCEIETHPGEQFDAVFGQELGYADARALRERAEGFGFLGVKIEQTDCSEFRVLVTGVPAETGVQKELRREVESVGLRVSFAPAVRYPEVASDVEAVP